MRSKCTECEVFCVYCEVESFVINKEISGIFLSLGNGLITQWGLIFFRCILFDGLVMRGVVGINPSGQNPKLEFGI